MAERNGNDEWLAEKLKAEADRYEPDLARIRQRIRERGADQPVRRSTWLLPAAAATFVVLTAGAITALHGGGPSDPSEQVQVVGSGRTGTDSPSAAPVETSSGGPSPASSTASSVTSEPIGSTTPDAAKTTGSAATGAPRPGVDLKLAAAQPGRAVTLPGGAVDWIAAGSGPAAQTVRSERGGQQISGPHETGTATSSSTTGPFALSWTGGLAERSQTGSRTWRTVSGPAGGPETGLIIRVPAGKQTATLVLYVGADGADGQLRTRLGAQGKVTRTRLKAVSGGGYVVTIRYHTEGSGEELTTELIAGSGGSISFAAATLR